MRDPDQLTISDVASLVGVSVASVRKYLVRGTIPDPDGRLGATPWWHRSTIETWCRERRGRGRPKGADYGVVVERPISASHAPPGAR